MENNGIQTNGISETYQFESTFRVYLRETIDRIKMQRRLTYKDLARKCRISPTTLRRSLTGQRDMTTRDLFILAQELWIVK
jgi:transcriptional regulator with XRE-family HTH domain